MNTLENRLRDALRERAARSPVDPHAWERVLDRTGPVPRRGGRLGGLRWPARYVVPALAAAAVAGIIITSNVLAGRLPDGPAEAPAISASMASLPPPELSWTRPLSRDVPPSSAVLTYRYAAAGTTISAFFWLGHRSPAMWFDNVSPGLQLCSAILNIYTSQQPEYGTTGPLRQTTAGSGQSFCTPVPRLRSGQVVRVTGGINAGNGTGAFATMSMRSGIATGAVTSVSAVLPDGRTFTGVVGTGRGFGVKVWSVTYPPDGALRVVFRDASGHQLASLTRPAVPAALTQGLAQAPGSGGVALAGRSLTAYLIDGHVGFWPDRLGGPLIAPEAASGGPALAGILVSVGQAGSGSAQDPYREVSELVGYAHADVARVVLRMAGRNGFTQLTASTLAAGWPGTTVRLWAAAAPAGAYLDTSQDTATAYDAAGHVIAVVHLGTQAAPSS